MALDTQRETGEPYLGELGKILSEMGLKCRVVAPVCGQRPFLRVVNTKVADLAEDVSCGYCSDDRGQHWFIWSWREAIGPVSDIENVAKTIARVLSAAE